MGLGRPLLGARQHRQGVGLALSEATASLCQLSAQKAELFRPGPSSSHTPLDWANQVQHEAAHLPAAPNACANPRHHVIQLEEAL